MLCCPGREPEEAGDPNHADCNTPLDTEWNRRFSGSANVDRGSGDNEQSQAGADQWNSAALLLLAGAMKIVNLDPDGCSVQQRLIPHPKKSAKAKRKG